MFTLITPGSAFNYLAYMGFACFVAQVLWNIYYKLLYWFVHLPPGSMGLPVVGHTLEFARKKFQVFDELHKKHGNIFKLHLLGVPTIRVRGPQGVGVILRDQIQNVASYWPSSTQAIIGENSVSMAHGQAHKNRKMRMLKMLSSNNLEVLFPQIQSVMNKHLEAWSSLGTIPLYESVSKMFVDIILTVCFGEHAIDLCIENDARLISEATICVPINLPGFTFRKGVQARKRILEQLSLHIDDIINRNSDCPLSKYITDETMTSTEERECISDLIVDILNAGRETNTSAACNLVVKLAQNAHVRENICEELTRTNLYNSESKDLTYHDLLSLDYVHWTVKEILRILPPVGGGFRVALNSFNVLGYTVPKSSRVVYSIRNTHAAQNLPDREKFQPHRWDTNNPDRPDRTRYAYIPFGAGVRSCPGRLLATILLRLFTVTLCSKFHIQLIDGDFEPSKTTITPRPSSSANIVITKLTRFST